MPAKKDKVFFSVTAFYDAVSDLAISIEKCKDKRYYLYIYPIPQGGCALATVLNSYLRNMGYGETMVIDTEIFNKITNKRSVLVVDDVIDSGKTIAPFMEMGCGTAVLHRKPWATVTPDFCYKATADWIIYWWEGTQEKSIKDSVLRQLQYIGEDPERDGLKETPDRVIRSYEQLYSGYKLDVAPYFKIFEIKRDEMIILKDIEFYSTCEHHMLPFFGKAHIAYLPKDKVIGVSKLARILEVYTRRLQIQERICQQVTEALDTHLRPLGSACILEAQHFCMTSRGIQKQNSKMITSSLTGVFKTNSETRAELMSFIK